MLFFSSSFLAIASGLLNRLLFSSFRLAGAITSSRPLGLIFLLRICFARGGTTTLIFSLLRLSSSFGASVCGLGTAGRLTPLLLSFVFLLRLGTWLADPEAFRFRRLVANIGSVECILT